MLKKIIYSYPFRVFSSIITIISFSKLIYHALGSSKSMTEILYFFDNPKILFLIFITGTLMSVISLFGRPMENLYHKFFNKRKQETKPEKLSGNKEISSLKIEFEDNYYKDIEEDGYPVRFYWLFIHNISSRTIKGVTVDLIDHKGHHRLSFHNGDVPEKVISNGNRERIDLLSYKESPKTKNRILVLNTNEEIDIDFGIDCVFTIEVHAIDCSLESQDYAACVKTIKRKPELTMRINEKHC